MNLAALRSVRSGEVAWPRRIVAIVVIGASGTGKTTLVDAIRDARLPGVDVPTRYTTRPPRGGDTVENVHVTEDDFAQRAREGRLGVQWRRSLEGDRVVQYGFDRPRDGAMPVYSANNAICRGGVHPAGALDRALIVGVFAPDELRAERLQQRSGDLGGDELGFRLAEPARDIEPYAHLVIANHGALEPIARADAIQLVLLASEHGR